MPYLLGVAGRRRQAGSSFSPIDVANILFWYMSDIGVTCEGDPPKLARWDDQSGGGEYMLCVTESEKALCLDDQINGLSILRFDGVDDHIASRQKDTWGRPLTIYVVFKLRAWEAYHNVIAGSNNSAMAFAGRPEENHWGFRTGSIFYGDIVLSLDTWYILMLYADAGTPADWGFRINALAEQNGNTNFFSDMKGIGIPGYYNEQNAAVDLTNVLVYQSMPPSEDADIMSYLNTKYGGVY